MGTVKLTERQKKILFFIIRYREQHGYPPTLREIGDEFGIASPNGVKEHLKALDRKGYIRLVKNTARGIELPDKKPDGVPLSPRTTVPLLDSGGTKQSPFPVDQQNRMVIEDLITVDDATFACEIKDDGMKGAGICSGDVILARSATKVKKGEPVVAVIGDSIVLRLYGGKTSKGTSLAALNPEYKTIVSKNVQILGVPIGLLRKF